MKKVLLVATVQSHICQFHLPLIDMLHEKGCEVHVAAKNNLGQKKGLKLDNADKVFDIQFERSPIKRNNIKAYKQLKEIIKKEDYDIIHCNTPMGGVLTRLVKRNNKNIKAKIIYTAHGFHFYKGAPILNWMVYYPIEKYLSKYTDCLVTINKEDYNLAKEKFYSKEIIFTHGVGVNKEKFNLNMSKEETEKYRKELGIKKDDFVIIYVGELNKNKNHFMLLLAIKDLVSKHNNIKLILPGNGPLSEKYEDWIKKNNLENNIKLLGYRRDIPQLMKISNIAVSTSRREGLPVNVIESMISGLPDIVTNCRGNRELIKNGENGYIVELDNINDLKKNILELYENSELRLKMGKKSVNIVKPYLLENVINELEKVYEKYL